MPKSLLLFPLLLILAMPSLLSAAELNFFYSNNVHGETEPCG